MSPALALGLLASPFAAYYLIRVALFPWKTCTACDGKGRIYGGNGIHRDCKRCKTKGRVRRFGAGRGQ